MSSNGMNGKRVKVSRIGNMAFSVPCVHRFLKEKGYVYTVRGYRMRDMKVNVKDIGVCVRKRCVKRNGNDLVMNKEDLKKLVEYSGFDSLDAWWDKINMFCGNKNKWCYFVKVKNVAL